ncbi:MAG: DUF1573 domain-containing protein [Planctomycetia bacterium]|nr:DUF1573 domain-containing protein [Planctomycetia bacterium]
MRKTQLILLFIVGAGVAAVAGTVAADRWSSWFGPQSVPPPPVAQPDLVIDPQYLDFGEVWETDEFEWSLPIQNQSHAPIRIARWINSCGCLSIEPAALDLRPGETATVKIRLDLTAKLHLNPDTVQPVVVGIDAVLGDGSRGPTWVIRGKVKTLLSSNPDLIFKQMPDVAQPYPAKQLSLDLVQSATNLTVESDSPHITAFIQPGNGQPQARVPIELRFAHSIPLGDHKFSLTVRGEFGSPRCAFSKRLNGILSVVPDVQPEPGAVVFPARRLGEEAEDVIALKSLTGATFRIESVTAEGDGLSATLTKAEPQITIRQRSAKLGQHVAHVKVVATSGGRVYQLTIPVTSLWIQPEP